MSKNILEIKMEVRLIFDAESNLQFRYICFSANFAFAFSACYRFDTELLGYIRLTKK